MPNLALQFETLPNCPICGEEQAELVLSRPDGYIPELYLQRCVGCRVIYLNPRLAFSSTVAVENVSEVYNLTPGAAEEWISKGWSRLVGLLGKHVKSKRRRLLDIGCNRGLLMEAARRKGWQVTGVEISSVAAQHARDDYHLTVYPALEEVPVQAQFDLIVAWHVLEHAQSPIAFLRTAAARLAPGGALAIQVPSFDFLADYERQNQLSSLVCSVHNFYFTLEGLRTVLQKAGLPLVRIENDADHLLLTAICAIPGPPMNWWQKLWQQVGIYY